MKANKLEKALELLEWQKKFNQQALKNEEQVLLKNNNNDLKRRTNTQATFSW